MVALAIMVSIPGTKSQEQSSTCSSSQMNFRPVPRGGLQGTNQQQPQVDNLSRAGSPVPSQRTERRTVRCPVGRAERRWRG